MTNPKSITARKKGKSLLHEGVFPYQWAFTLLFPLRKIFLSPMQVMERLELKENHTVLEVGPGPGFFSTYAAKKVHTGKLILADIQQEMLNHARKRLEKRKIHHVEYHLCNGYDFDFPDASFDRIFMVTVLGEVENKESYMKEFYRLLKPGGILSISEQAGDPDKLTVEQIKHLTDRVGFDFYRIFTNRRSFTINFKKTS